MTGAVALVVLAAVGTTACNKSSSSDDDDEYATDATMTACTGFKLKADSKVKSNLDSVFFSIDIARSVIFNADSLPMGAKITKLVPVITYPSNVSAVTLRYFNENGEQTVNYLENSSDSIDFSNGARLTITAQDGVNSRTYDIKVNVHKMNPDSLVWTNPATSKLPSRLANPRAQRTVAYGDMVLSLIEESDGTLTLASMDAAGGSVWQKQIVATSYNLDIRSLTATSDELYILDTSGNLLKSADGLSWTDTGADWTGILGGYGSTLLGLRLDGSTMKHTSYPAGAQEKVVDSRFPVTGSSNMLCISSKWSPWPIGVIAGGRMADGQLSGSAWGFDGEQWAELTSNYFAPVEDATLLPYFVTRKSSWLWYRYEDSAFMIVGGRGADGAPTKNLWYSINNGVIWTKAGAEAQMPEEIPAAYALDGLVLSTPMSGSLTDAWKAAERPCRLNYQVTGYDVSWECPYIYLFGGIGADGKLIPTVRRGVLARLTFMPMI